MLDLAWDSHVDDALLRLNRNQIADPDYWFSTVDIVEAGYDPTTRKPITVTQLDAWVNRCKTKPTQEDQPNASTSRTISPSQ